MNLGIFLQPGESFLSMAKSGQDTRFKKLYIERFSKEFDQVFMFSYADEKYKLPKNVLVVPNKTNYHRWVYGIFLSWIHKDKIVQCDVIRGFGLLSSISSFLLSKPFVFNWAYDYISFVKADKQYIYMPFYFLLEKLAFLKAKVVMVQTKAKFNTLKGSKFVYMPNGVDLSLFTVKNNTKKGLLFIGRLEPQKNLSFLLKAINLLDKRYHKVTFVGAGSQKDELIKLAEELKINLTIIDSVPNPEIPKIMRDYSIFLLPSLNEGIPKVLIEAMSLGLVPIVTKFITAEEVVTNNIDGFITDYDPKIYSSKIKKLLEDKRLWNKMSSNARIKIEKQFDQTVLMNRELKILHQLAV